MLTPIIAFVVVISILIFVHELGHFFAAKSVDIAAPRFSIGLGPRVWGFRWGETDFVVSAIPLGGYVKMAGMEGDEAGEALEGGAAASDEPPVDPSRTFDAKSLPARAWVISAGVIMNVLFAFVVFTGVGMIWGEPQAALTPVAPVADSLRGPWAPLSAVERGDELVAVGGETVGSWNEVADRVLAAPTGPLELRFERSPAVTVQLPEGEEARARLFAALNPLSPASIGQVEPGSPADLGGLETGDRIVAVDGQPVRFFEDVVRLIETSPGRAVPFEVERDGGRQALTITPEERRDEATGRVQGRIGVGSETPLVNRELGVGEAFAYGARTTWGTTRLIAVYVGRLFSGQESARSVGGIIAIGEMSGQAAEMGAQRFLEFMGLLSINLAILNLLPIPILDGGHLMFLAIEAVRGRPLSLEARIRLSHVGLILVVALMLWANGNDILRKLGI